MNLLQLLVSCAMLVGGLVFIHYGLLWHGALFVALCWTIFISSLVTRE